MKARLKDCVDIFKNQFQNMSAEELKDYAREVLLKAKSYDGIRGIGAIKKAQAEVGESFKKEFFEDAQITINNHEKFESILTKIKNKAATVRDFIGRRYTNKGNNIESSQKASANKLMDSFEKDLNPEDIAYLLDRNNNMEIASAFDGNRASPIAEKIASSLKRYIEDRNVNLVMSNAMKLSYIQGDRYLRAVHSSEALLRGGRSPIKEAFKNGRIDRIGAKTKWISEIKKHINLEETFKRTDAITEDGILNLEQVDKTLSTIFDNIVTNKSEIFTRSQVLNDLEAQQKRSRMFFVWKDMTSLLKYNEVYGEGDLFSAVMKDIHSSGNKIGAAEIFGDTPAQMYAHLRKEQIEINPKNSLWWHNTDIFYNEVTGANRSITSPTIAHIGANLRTFTSMARLPGLVMTSLSDMNTAASYMSQWGEHYGAAFVKHVGTWANALSKEEKKQIGEMMHLSLKSQMGYLGRFADTENVGQLTHKISTKYFRLIGMQKWDQGNRMAAMTQQSFVLGKNAANKFSALKPEVQKQLGKFDIGEHEWDALRKYTKGNLFTLDNVQQLTDADLKALYAARGGKTSYYELRNELYRNVFSLFDVAAEQSILTPNAWIRTLMFQGTKAGTPMGEIMRVAMQFKGFALSYIDRALIEGFKNADGRMAKLGYALQQFGFVVPLSYMSTYFYYWSQGTSMPDTSKMTWAERVSFYAGIMAPGLGIFSGILDPQKQDQGLLLSLFATPTTRVVSSGLSSALSLMGGDVDKAGKNLSKTVQYLTPVGTLPFASPYIKQFMGDQPYKRPGQSDSSLFDPPNVLGG